VTSPTACGCCGRCARCRRLASHERVTALIADAFLAAYPQADAARVRLTTRLAVDMGSAALDLLFDAPGLDPQQLSRTLAAMISSEMLAMRKG
jgi:hypothetical protein